MDTTDPLLTRQIVEAIRGGDRIAYDNLFRHVGGRVYVYIVNRMGEKLRGAMDAEDILQDVYLKAFEVFDEFVDRGSGSMARWLIGIAKNQIRRQLKHLGYEKRDPDRVVPLGNPSESSGTPSTSPQPPSPASTPSRAVARDEQAQRMARAVEALGPEEKELVLLHFFEGLTLDEIARDQGVSRKTLSRHLARALKQVGVKVQ